jgi:acyl carrier protein
MKDPETTMANAEIFGRVRAMVADSLAVDEAGVALQSRLVDDLGADSLDFLDMMFTLEKTFRIGVREAEFDFLSRLDFSDPAVMRDGFLTRETIEKLLPRLPALANVPDRTRITPAQIFSLITVETLCRIVEQALERVAGGAP